MDVERSLGFCQQLKLAPSEGPYVFWTADYPSEPLAAAAEGATMREAIALGGLRAIESRSCCGARATSWRSRAP